MYDAANIRNIPADATLVGYYVDGAYVPSGADMARLRSAKFVGIAVFPTDNKGIVFDGPPDNSTWPQVVSWVQLRRRAGVDPTVYCDLDQWTVGQAAFRSAGVAQPHWWIASWNGKQELIPGTVGHQYTGDQNGGFDRSVMADYWPGVDDAPAPSAPPAPAAPKPIPQEEPMLIISVTPDPWTGGTGAGKGIVSGPLIAHIPDGGSYNALKAAGISEAAISPATYKAMAAASAALKGALSGSLGVSGSLTVS
jgi:hypothetical protein